ncbi:MAG: helix-turn-helix domain-containing protein [Peptoclostridium sp.]|uniref:helix-turn-helix domain-containing protein n=1 Tax=Peptoclostridium sp. TaxID=1904860 RepID=UPI00139C1082|nr:helix-turn-helix domain-containing protein [Peptoclostridium sp.]MZQ74767.1 helix-turn-helix domain-containing protein [Peptoclostridium sp.]
MEILTLGQKIKKLRKERNLTLKELAGNRVTAAQISHIERDKSYPSQDLLDYFSQKLSVSVDYLVESKEAQVKQISESILLKGEYYIKNKKLKSAKDELTKVIELCKEYNVNSLCANAKFLLGQVYRDEGDYTMAASMFERSLILNIKTSNVKGALGCYLELGKVYMLQKCYKPATDKFIQGKNYLVDNNVINYDIERLLYINLSYCSMELGEYDDAIFYSKKVDEIEEKMKDYKHKGNSLFLLGNKYMGEGDYIRAKKYFSKALDVFNEHEKKLEQARTYVVMSYIHENLKQYEEALEKVKIAYEIHKDIENEHLVEIMFDYTRALLNKGDIESAKELSKKALAMSIKLKNKLLEAKAIKYYAKAHLKEGNVEIALENMNRNIELVSKYGAKKDIADAYFEAADIYAHVSKDKELECYSKGVELYKELKIIYY